MNAQRIFRRAAALTCHPLPRLTETSQGHRVRPNLRNRCFRPAAKRIHPIRRHFWGFFQNYEMCFDYFVCRFSVKQSPCVFGVPGFCGSSETEEERIKELLITFGQLKFYALQKDEEGKSARAKVSAIRRNTKLES